MKIDCEIIKDLLPLYAEDILSEKSRQLVAEHLTECGDCRKMLAEIKEPTPHINHNADPIKKLKRDFKKHTITVAAISAFVTIAAIVLVWGLFLMQPGDEMGYVILSSYFILPLAAIFCSWAVASRQTIIKWFLPIIFGVIGWLLPLAVFGTTEPVFAGLAFVPSVIGLLIGKFVAYVKKLQ